MSSSRNALTEILCFSSSIIQRYYIVLLKIQRRKESKAGKLSGPPASNFVVGARRCMPLSEEDSGGHIKVLNDICIHKSYMLYRIRRGSSTSRNKFIVANAQKKKNDLELNNAR